MQLLLDQGLPRTAAKLLRDAGIDTLHVGEIGMAAAKDIQILEHAESEERRYSPRSKNSYSTLTIY